jgi:hypothetical protein
MTGSTSAPGVAFLTFTAPIVPSSPATNINEYYVQYSTVGGAQLSKLFESADVTDESGVVTLEINNIPTADTYKFGVFALNSFANLNSSPQILPDPSNLVNLNIYLQNIAVSNLTVKSGNPNMSVNLAWAAPPALSLASFETIAGYQIFRDGVLIGSTGAQQTYYIDESTYGNELTSAELYTYTVFVQVNVTEYGSVSSIQMVSPILANVPSVNAYAYTPPLAPVNLVIENGVTSSSLTATQLSASWSNPAQSDTTFQPTSYDAVLSVYDAQTSVIRPGLPGPPKRSTIVEEIINTGEAPAVPFLPPLSGGTGGSSASQWREVQRQTVASSANNSVTFSDLRSGSTYQLAVISNVATSTLAAGAPTEFVDMPLIKGGKVSTESVACSAPGPVIGLAAVTGSTLALYDAAAAADSTNAVNVSWQAPQNMNGMELQSFKVSRTSVASSGTATTVVLNAQYMPTPSSSGTYTYLDLTAPLGSSCTYTVSANANTKLNTELVSGASSTSNAVTPFTQAAALDFTGVASVSSASLNWKKPTLKEAGGLPVASYKITSGPITVATLGPADTNYIVYNIASTPLTPGNSYSFTIVPITTNTNTSDQVNGASNSLEIFTFAYGPAVSSLAGTIFNKNIEISWATTPLQTGTQRRLATAVFRSVLDPHTGVYGTPSLMAMVPPNETRVKDTGNGTVVGGAGVEVPYATGLTGIAFGGVGLDSTVPTALIPTPQSVQISIQITNNGQSTTYTNASYVGAPAAVANYYNRLANSLLGSDLNNDNGDILPSTAALGASGAPINYGDTYKYTVISINVDDTYDIMSASAAASVTVYAHADNIPAVPSVTAKSGENLKIPLSWTVPQSMDGYTCTGYNIYKLTGSQQTLLATVASTATTYTVHVNSNGNKEIYGVSIIGTLPNVNETYQSIQPTPSNHALAWTTPGSVGSFTLTPGNATITATWTAPPATYGLAGTTNYKLNLYKTSQYNSAVPSESAPVLATSGWISDLTYVFKNTDNNGLDLVNGTQYTVTIVAGGNPSSQQASINGLDPSFDSSNYNNPSTTLSADTRPQAPPTILSVVNGPATVNAGDSSVTLRHNQSMVTVSPNGSALSYAVAMATPTAWVAGDELMYVAAAADLPSGVGSNLQLDIKAHFRLSDGVQIDSVLWIIANGVGGAYQYYDQSQPVPVNSNVAINPVSNNTV